MDSKTYQQTGLRASTAGFQVARYPRLTLPFLIPLLALNLLSLCLATSAHASYQVALTKEKVKRKTAYTLNFLSEDSREVRNVVPLNELRREPMFFRGSEHSRFWMAMRPVDSKEWVAASFSAETGQEGIRISLGVAPLLNPGPTGFWLQESADGSLVSLILRKSNYWWFSTHRADTGEEIASAKLKKGLYQVTELPQHRFLIELREIGTEKLRRIYLINGLTGEVLLNQRVNDLKGKPFQLSVSNEHLYLVKRKRKSGQVKLKGERFKKEVTGDKTELQVFSTLDGKLIAEESVGYNLTDLVTSRDATYAISQTSLASIGHKVWEIDGERISMLRQSESDCPPVGLALDPAKDRLAVFCSEGVFEGRLSKPNDLQYIETGVALRRGIYVDDAVNGSALFALSRRSGRVAKIGLTSQEHIATRKTGRTGTKIAQFLGNAVAVGIMGTAGLAVAQPYDWSNVTLKNHHENSDRFFVFNYGTSELTQLGGVDFARGRVYPIVTTPIGFLEVDQQVTSNVFFASEERLIGFIPTSEDPAIDLNKGLFLGVSNSSDRLFYVKNNQLEIRSLSELNIVAKHPELSNCLQILTHD